MKSVTLLVALVATSSSSLPNNSYKEAYQQHLEDGRPLVVLLGADWCPACRTMKSSYLPQAAREGVLNDVAFTVVDVDAERRLANQMMRGGSIPQLVMYYRDGDQTRRVQLTGAHDVASIRRFIEAGLSEKIASE